MAIVFEDWLALNEQRSYPLHDLALRQADSGIELPNDILTDIHIVLPKSAGKAVYVSSVGLTANLISLTFLAAPHNPLEVSGSSSSSAAPSPAVPVAAIRLVRPIVPYKNYPLESLYPGVAGWVSFGTGVNKREGLHLLFSSPAAAWLCARCVRQVSDSPVTGAGKVGLSARLKGMVLLSGSDNISIAKERRIIDGLEQDALIFALKVPTGNTLQGVLQEFSAPCNNRPAEGTCKSAGLVSINEVAPDMDGNINLVFKEGSEIIGDSGDGMVVDYPLGLSEVCPPKTYDPYAPDDECESSLSSSSSSSSSSESSSSSSSEQPTDSSSSGDFCNPLSASLGMLQAISGLGLGSWHFAPGEDGPTRLITMPGELVHHIVDSAYRFRVFNDGEDVVISGLVRPTQTPSGEGHMIFGYKSTNNFFFAGLTLRASALYPQGMFFVGRKASGGPVWPSGLGLGYNFLTGGQFLPLVPLTEVDYDISVRVHRISATTAQAQLSVTWVDAVSGAQAYVSPWVPLYDIDMNSFRVGMGAVYSPNTEFANWCVEGGRLMP
jgi:hypothetical protein